MKFFLGLIIGVALGYFFNPQISKLLKSSDGKKIVETTKEVTKATTDGLKKAANDIKEKIED